ncbi:hypothetical protein CPC08DRAFT_393222 [Agrocybe pediades]|nr:hypothetical protein CPC08DRAFT_393222 [Agrocybe pediades]
MPSTAPFVICRGTRCCRRGEYSKSFGYEGGDYPSCKHWLARVALVGAVFNVSYRREDEQRMTKASTFNRNFHIRLQAAVEWSLNTLSHAQARRPGLSLTSQPPYHFQAREEDPRRFRSISLWWCYLECHLRHWTRRRIMDAKGVLTDKGVGQGARLVISDSVSPLSPSTMLQIPLYNLSLLHRRDDRQAHRHTQQAYLCEILSSVPFQPCRALPSFIILTLCKPPPRSSEQHLFATGSVRSSVMLGHGLPLRYKTLARRLVE